MSAPRSIPKPKLSEADFQRQVCDLAKVLGWKFLHVRKSMGRRGGAAGWQTTTNIAGWPDLLLFKPGRIVAAELKSDVGVATPEQRDVLADLEAAGAQAFVWRPRDWDDVVRVLRGTS